MKISEKSPSKIYDILYLNVSQNIKSAKNQTSSYRIIDFQYNFYIYLRKLNITKPVTGYLIVRNSPSENQPLSFTLFRAAAGSEDQSTRANDS